MKEKTDKKLPLIVVCGRTNVGKSTLFNCLTGKNQALVSTIAGTTRDSNLGIVEWSTSVFNIVDTAGLITGKCLNENNIDYDIDRQAQKQSRAYLDKADLILFLVDTKAGLLGEDKELAAGLRKNNIYRQKTILIANKVDNFKSVSETAQFNKLGLGEPFPISAANGMNTGDLLDAIKDRLTKEKRRTIKEVKREIDEPEKETTKDQEAARTDINVCIIGKPNVGKSSLLNAILGYERVIVSPIAHTTREPQNTEITYQDRKITLVDTAGISKQGKKAAGLEKYGILKSLTSLDKADIALLVVDISEPLTHQDAKLVQEIVDRQKSLVFIANKWDKIKGRDTKKWTEILYDKLPFAAWAPVQFISAKTGEKVNKIIELIITIADQRRLFLSDSQTEKFLKHVIKLHKPAKGKGTRAPRIYEFRQTKNDPPSFSLRIGPDDDLHFSYIRFLENRLRERHGFTGTPINIRIAKFKKSHTTYNPNLKKRTEDSDGK